MTTHNPEAVIENQDCPTERKELASYKSLTSSVCVEMREMCYSCGGTGDVHRPDGEYMGQCCCQYGGN